MGHWQPATPEYFYKDRGVLRSRCKACERERVRRYQTENPEKEHVRSRRYRAANVEKIREKDQRYYAENVERIREAKRRYRVANPEKIREQHRQWYEANTGRVRENQRRWRTENVERVRETARRRRQANLEKARVHRRRWQQTNPEKVREQKRRRRAQKRNLAATFTSKHERIALDYFNGCCAVCERQLKDLFGTHTVNFDHWIPLSKGGGTTPDNMLPLCGGLNGCNNRKHVSDPVEWINREFNPRQAKAILARIQTYFAYIKQYTKE